MIEGNWDQVATEVDFNLEIDRMRILGMIDRKSKVLDFGCGYGRITNLLGECGYTDVKGVDPSRAMIERGRKAFPGVSLMHLEGVDLPFDNNAFDLVVICAVFTCIPSLDKRAGVAAELNRVLRPGGIIHMAEFCSEESKSFISGLGLPMRYSNPKELRTVFSDFSCLHDEVASTNTMSGESACSYRAFLQKPLNKTMHATSA